MPDSISVTICVVRKIRTPFVSPVMSSPLEAEQSPAAVKEVRLESFVTMGPGGCGPRW